MSKTIIIIGAGLAGLSAALQAAENGCNVKLVSSLPSERAQSVMAEGGINAALNTKDENDSPEEHFTDTIKAACGLADPNAVWGMTQAAPELVHWLLELGVQFNMSGYDDVDLRNFGGQKKKRTAFAQSDTGKQIMTAMIDAVRRKEASGMVERFSHHSFLTLRLCGNICCGCVIRDEYSQETVELPGGCGYCCHRWYARIVWKYNGFAEQYRRSHRRIVPAWCSSGKWRDDPVPSDNCEMWWKTHAHQRGGQRGRWQVVCHERWKTMVFHGGKIPGAWKSDATRYYRQRDMEGQP